MRQFQRAASAGTMPVMARRAIEEGATEKRAAMATRLTQLRSVLNSNQAAVARLVGCGTNTWNRYEKGVRDLDVYALAEFCKIFSVSADWVLSGDLYSLPKEVIAQLVASYPEVVQGKGGLQPPKRRQPADMAERVAPR